MAIQFLVLGSEEEFFSRLSEKLFTLFKGYSSNGCAPPTTGWLTHKEAARYLKTSSSSLYKLSSARKIPFSKRGKQNFYRVSDLEIYLGQGVIGSFSSKKINFNLKKTKTNATKR